MEIAWLCDRFILHLSAMGVAEVAKSTHLKTCPHTHFSKTKELIVNYRKRRAEHAPIHIDGAVVEQVESFKVLGDYITKELSESTHTKSVVKKAQQAPQEAENIWHGPSKYSEHSTAASLRRS